MASSSFVRSFVIFPGGCVCVILPPSQGLRSIFFSESQTMLGLTKFL
jgi:hypothetical protein